MVIVYPGDCSASVSSATALVLRKINTGRDGRCWVRVHYVVWDGRLQTDPYLSAKLEKPMPAPAPSLGMSTFSQASNRYSGATGQRVRRLQSVATDLTGAQRAEIAAHAIKHGLEVAGRHFHISKEAVQSVMRLQGVHKRQRKSA